MKIETDALPDLKNKNLPDFEKWEGLLESAYNAVHGESATPDDEAHKLLDKLQKIVIAITEHMSDYLDTIKKIPKDFEPQLFECLQDFESLGKYLPDPATVSSSNKSSQTLSSRSNETEDTVVGAPSRAVNNLAMQNYHFLQQLKPELKTHIEAAFGETLTPSIIQDTEVFDKLFVQWVRTEPGRGEQATFILFRTEGQNPPLAITLHMRKSHNLNKNSDKIDSFYITQLDVRSFWDIGDVQAIVKFAPFDRSYNSIHNQGHLWQGSQKYGFAPSMIAEQIITHHKPDFPRPQGGKPWSPGFFSAQYARKSFLLPFQAYADGTDENFSAERDLNLLVDSNDLHLLMQRLRNDSEVGCLLQVAQ